MIINTHFHFTLRKVSHLLFFRRKVGKRTSHPTQHFILPKFFGFQRTFFKKSFASGSHGGQPQLIIHTIKQRLGKFQGAVYYQKSQKFSIVCKTQLAETSDSAGISSVSAGSSTFFTSISLYFLRPVPAGISLPIITFSLSPIRWSTLPFIAASVRTFVVSWKEAAERNDSV